MTIDVELGDKVKDLTIVNDPTLAKMNGKMEKRNGKEITTLKALSK